MRQDRGAAAGGYRIESNELKREVYRLPAMDEERQLQAKIARYRRTQRAVFDPDVLRRLGQMIETAEKRLAEIERA
jgi:predicted  nucleic acid-binding Zn-ribbon protein